MTRWVSTASLKFSATQTYGWLTRHPRMAMSLVWLVGGLVYLAVQIWSIYAAIPGLPNGALQIVGLTQDGARYLATDEILQKDHRLGVIVLVVFEKPLQTNGVVIRFEAKKQWIDCAKSEIELEGAGFYNDKGTQVLSRVFDHKPQAAGLIDAEVDYLCHPKLVGVSPVTGYQAAWAQQHGLHAQRS